MAIPLGVGLANQSQVVEGDRSSHGQQSMLAEQENAFLQEIENSARDRAGAMVERHPSGLTVSASGPRGFSMSVMVENGRYVVYFDNWFEEFDCPETARQMFEAALKGEARLKVDMLSGRRWRWTLERRDDAGTWHTESTTGHVIWRFWGRQSSVYLRNAFPPLMLPTDAAGHVRAN
jgi:hypothetical protein